MNSAEEWTGEREPNLKDGTRHLWVLENRSTRSPMYQDFGAIVTDHGVEFRVFFPDNSVDPSQYSRGGLPRIKTLRVAGDFQEHLGGTNWDFRDGPSLERLSHPKGILYSLAIDDLPEGYYQYKYFVEFENGSTRWCGDPCTKYGGAEKENAAFIIGGNKTTVRPIANRLPLKDLVIYEMMVDDFTSQFRNGRAPFEAILDKIPYLKTLGINAIEFMPWTAWPGSDFSWGYDPSLFFSVEHRYVHSSSTPLDKLFKLQTLINALHENEIHVIMDGVFNHAKAQDAPGEGFPYYWFYENPADCPFVGNFEWTGYFEDLDFSNACTAEFIGDACKYWINEFQIDGIRFDYVRGFFTTSHPPKGIARLVTELNEYAASTGRQNVALTLELLTDNRFEAVGITNRLGATGCWFDPLMWEGFGIVAGGHIGTSLMRRLNAGKDFDGDKSAITYIENHDHSTLTEYAGGRSEKWWRTQPLAVALFTCAGAPMVHNGQEFGEQYWFPESGDGRVQPRPLRWAKSADTVGNTLIALYAKLAQIRHNHPSLRSANFYPEPYDEGHNNFNSQGYGVDVKRDVAIYHRWGNDEDGILERFIIVLNFSDIGQSIDIPFPENGAWEDLLNGGTAHVNGYWLKNESISSNWGRIYFKRG